MTNVNRIAAIHEVRRACDIGLSNAKTLFDDEISCLAQQNLTNEELHQKVSERILQCAGFTRETHDKNVDRICAFLRGETPVIRVFDVYLDTGERYLFYFSGTDDSVIPDEFKEIFHYMLANDKTYHIDAGEYMIR